MASPPRLLHEGIQTVTHAELIACLSDNEDFTHSQSFQEQCFITCHIMCMEYTSPIPFSVLGHLLDIDKGIIR
jgi:hypothetical protein